MENGGVTGDLRERAILGAEINHRFCGIRTVYLFRTLADSRNNQFLFAEIGELNFGIAYPPVTLQSAISMHRSCICLLISYPGSLKKYLKGDDTLGKGFPPPMGITIAVNHNRLPKNISALQYNLTSLDKGQC